MFAKEDGDEGARERESSQVRTAVAGGQQLTFWEQLTVIAVMAQNDIGADEGVQGVYPNCRRVQGFRMQTPSTPLSIFPAWQLGSICP